MASPKVTEFAISVNTVLESWPFCVHQDEFHEAMIWWASVVLKEPQIQYKYLVFPVQISLEIPLCNSSGLT